MEPDPPMPSVGDAPPGEKKPRPHGCIFWAVVAALLLLLTLIALPNFVRPGEHMSGNACVNNLRQIQAAKESWAKEHRLGGDAVPTFADLVPYLGPGGASVSNIVCYGAGAGATFNDCYEIGAVTTPPKCKIGANFAAPHILELKP